MKKYKLAILGDMHFEKQISPMINEALDQIKAARPNAMVALGDVGGYSHPGTLLSFMEAKEIFSTLPFLTYPLIGNHDLEGIEFSSDEENLKAWLSIFEKPKPYYYIELESAILVLLSTTSFRKNPVCCHEIYIDDDQFTWFESLCNTFSSKNIFVFSHAPILGSGLRVLQNLHLMGGNAYLNHSRSPNKFIKLVERFKNIRFWASGHNHLGQDYPDSLSHIYQCTFCHTGVPGNITRDGKRQSRLLEFDDKELIISTIDHIQNKVIENAKIDLQNNLLTRKPVETITSNQKFISPPALKYNDYLLETKQSGFAISHQMLIEYDKSSGGPIGVVVDYVSNSAKIQFDQNSLEVYENGILSEKIDANNQGYYSVLQGITIYDHALSKYINNKNQGDTK